MVNWHIWGLMGSGDGYSVGSSDSECQSFFEESDSSDTGIGQTDNSEVVDELPDSFYEIDCILQAWWARLDITIAEPNDYNFTDRRTLGYGLASSQISTSQWIKEHDDRLGDDNLVQENMDQNADSKAISGCHKTASRKTGEQPGTTTEGEPDFETDSYTLGPNFADEQRVLPNAAEIEWEGPFSGFSEIDDLNESFGVLPLRL
ncbi:hypothetical protein F4801DRAFT_578176 [Xylaria longipes]|nr:hypothetical protein F4801DRAFT_578176 [Xylaria longipes]